MSEQRFPKGWDEQRVKQLIAELDARTDEEWIAADEAAAADAGDQVVITVPAALLPEIRRLLASHKSAKRAYAHTESPPPPFPAPVLMRILIATTHRMVVGGVETYLRALLPVLVARGHELSLLYEDVDAPGSAAVDDGVPDVPCWHFAGPDALRAAADWRPDVCFAHGLAAPQREAALLERFAVVLFAHNYHGTCISGSKCHSFPRAQPCGRTLGPLCLALHYARRCGGLNPRTTLRQYALQQRRRELLPRYRAVVVASRHMREEMVRHGVPAERVELLPLFPPGVEPDREPPAARPWTQRLLFAGRLTDLKGGAYLVPALAHARRALGRRLELVVAGDGPQRPALERLRGAGTCRRSSAAGWTDGGGPS